MNIEEKVYYLFQELSVLDVSFSFNWLSILHIPFDEFDEYNNFRHFHLNIIAELFIGISLLRNLTLITSHSTVL